MNKQTIEFHAILEAQVQRLGHGGMTINVFLKDGLPVISTLNIVKQRRKKYNLKGGGQIRLTSINKLSATLPR